MLFRSIARGKILPTSKFLAGLDNDTLRLPESVFGQMVTGADAETEALSYQAPDMILVPDADTIWYALTELLAGRMPQWNERNLKYD